ncbi:MAG: flagellar basal body rod protein FlgC [Bacillota bacterium]
MFDNFSISASGLTAQRLRMDVISENIANVNTTRNADGEPYRRKIPVFSEKTSSFNQILNNKMGKGNSEARGVEVDSINEDQSQFKMKYEPQHPDANEDGYVAMPNVNVSSEMVDMISASRAYEANVTALETAKDMAQQALRISQG